MTLRAITAAAALLAGLATGPARDSAMADVLAPLPAQSTGIPWPTRAWPAGEPNAGTSRVSLDSTIGDAFGSLQPLLGETQALVIIQGGRLVVERYGPGFAPDTRHVSWSVAKSITHALVGIAARQGKIDVDTPMGNPRWGTGDPRQRISWRQWLRMVDGQRYLELGAAKVTENDGAKMLFGAGRLDLAHYAASLPLAREPGVHWNYNTAAVVLVCDALVRAIAPEAKTARDRRAAMADWMRANLFSRLGMTSAQPEFDAQGLFIGGSLVYATARDFAKFGLLYLRGGIWEDRRILPAGWVDFARTPGPGRNADIYGAGWWLTPSRGTGRPGRALIATGGMRDAFSAQGRGGQVILVIPSKDLVVVRLGLSNDSGETWMALGDWLARVAAAFPDVAR